MRRVIEGLGYAKSVRRHLKDKQLDYAKAIRDDLRTLVSILASELPVPSRYKMHKLEGKRDVYDCHLVSRGSDDLLFFRKYKDQGIPTIKLLAVGPHTMAHRINAALIEDDDLLIDPEDLAWI